MSDAAADPGWMWAIREIPWSLLPFVRVRRFKRQAAEGRMDALMGLRSMFVIFAAAMVEIGIVVLILANSGSLEPADLPTAAVAGFIAAWGAAALVAVWAFGRRLDCSSDEALVGGYRTRFFLQLACAETAALVGFVGAIVTVNPAMYALGAAFTAVGFVLLAPSARNLARDQARIAAVGCRQNLTALLRRVYSV